MLRTGIGAAGFLLAGMGACLADGAQVLPDRPVIELVLNGQTLTISRPTDADAMLTGDYARTARACPPDCLQPIEAAPGVRTVAEVEVIGFLESMAASGQGLLLDVRLPDGYAKGRLPGSVNVPFATLAPANPVQVEILKALGVQATADGTLDFATAPTLVLYGDGPFSDQAAMAVRYLVETGYPVDKLNYYRGGMQEWLHSGLTVTGAANQG